MANRSPVGRRPHQERTDNLYDAGLTLVAEQREISAKRMQKLKLIARLEEADQIERERARHRVIEAKAELREALEDQERLDEISGGRAALWSEVLELEAEDERVTDEGERELAATGHHAGAAYVHPDLIAPKAMVAAQKRIDAEHVSDSEAEVV